jgi:hypothetical protein
VLAKLAEVFVIVCLALVLVAPWFFSRRRRDSQMSGVRVQAAGTQRAMAIDGYRVS